MSTANAEDVAVPAQVAIYVALTEGEVRLTQDDEHGVCHTVRLFPQNVLQLTATLLRVSGVDIPAKASAAALRQRRYRERKRKAAWRARRRNAVLNAPRNGELPLNGAVDG
jgi:hypothetical protein